MAISLAISEIFGVKQWPGLEIGVCGHSSSLKLVPFESLCAVSYSPSNICDIFSVKEWCDLENRVWVRSRSLEMALFDRSRTSFY